ncbi:MAG: SOS response-associated peptidase, partial [Chloroflexota bacterium]
MCGRFTLTVDPAQLQQAFPGLQQIPPELPPRYNIAPTQPVAVITNAQPHRLDYFTWGLVPSWAKDPGIASKLINARAETLAEKPAFRSAFKR